LYSTKYYYNIIIKEDETCRSCSMHGRYENAYKILVGKSQGNKPTGRLKRSLEDNIEKGLEENGCGDLDWIRVIQDGGLLGTW
jgi:hypothetical protein